MLGGWEGGIWMLGDPRHGCEARCGAGPHRRGRVRVFSPGMGLDQVPGRRTCSWHLQVLALTKGQTWVI